jgi:PAS domain S-box-containing protein
VSDLLTPTAQADFAVYLAEVRARRTVEGVMRVRTRSGEARIWRYRNLAVRDERGADVVLGVAQDVTEEHAARDALRVAAERYRNLFEAMPLPIFVYEEDSLRLLAANRAASSAYGYTHDELAQMTLADLHDPTDLASLERFRAAALSPVSQASWLHRSKGGARLEVDVVSHALDLEGRRARSLVVQNVTERNRLWRFKDGLISLAAHELRAPLTAIHASLTWVTECGGDRLRPAESAALRTAAQASVRMSRLIEDILDLEKAQAGGLELRPRPLAVRDVLVVALEANRPYAQALGVPLVLTGRVPDARLFADEERIVQVLTNLLTNAAKFSPGGQPVEVGAHRVPGNVRLWVQDRGPGVPAGFAGRIFQRFAQARGIDESRRGSGLGLAICKELVERMGGRIGFESAEGQGARFHFDLPEHGPERDPDREPPEDEQRLPGRSS